jgi:hypothetical protein
MFLKSRITLVITIATLVIGAPVATAMPIDARGEHAKSQSQVSTAPSGDLRGENAASQTQSVASGPERFTAVDLRGDAAREPFVRPVVVEVGAPASSRDVDWSAALVGLGAGAALVLLATAGVVTTRRRHAEI